MLDIDIAKQLFPNPLTMIVQLCSTGVLFYVVATKLWAPARKLMEKRAQIITSDLSLAKDELAMAKLQQAEASLALSTAYNKSKEIVKQAEEEALVAKAEIVAQAKMEAARQLERAHEQIAMAKEAMKDEMFVEMVSIAMSASEKLLQVKLDDVEDRNLVENFVKEIQNDEWIS